MIVILFGPPACGKGTQAQALVRNLGFKHIATGDLCRQLIQSGDELGLKIKDIVAKGQFPSDEIICQIMKNALQNASDKDLILDGVPRTLKQAIDLDHILALQQLKVDFVIDLVIEPSELVARVAGRYACKACGAVYHDEVNRPKKEGICDICGGREFLRRVDDTEEVLRKRLEIYEQMTSPVRKFYMQQGKVRQVNAAQSIEAVQHQIETIIKDYRKTSNIKES